MLQEALEIYPDIRVTPVSFQNVVTKAKVYQSKQQFCRPNYPGIINLDRRSRFTLGLFHIVI